MKNTITLLLLISCLSFFPKELFCQTYTPVWGPEIKKGKGMFSGHNLLTVSDNHYYIGETEKKKITIQKYDFDHKLVTEIEPPTEIKGEKVGFLKLISTQKGMFAILMGYDKTTSLSTVFTARLNENGLENPKKVYSFKWKPNLLTFIDPLYSNTIVSSDGNMVAIISATAADGKRENKKISVAVLDSEMNKIWDKTEELQYEENKLNIYHRTVSTDGKIYLLGKTDHESNEKLKNKLNADHKLFCFSDESFKEYPIRIGEEYAPEDLALFATETGFVVSGFYEEVNNRKSGLKGVFYTSGEMGRGITNVKVTPFEKELLDGLVSKRKIANGKGLSSAFNIGDFFQLEDGSIGFVAENQYSKPAVTGSRTTQGSVEFGDKYFADDLVIPIFSKEGNIINIQKIEKHSPNANPMFNFFHMTQANGKIYLAFTTSKQLKTLFGGTKDSAHYTTNLAILNNKGELLQNESLFYSKDKKLEFSLLNSGFSKTALLIGTGGSKKQYGLVRLE